jgi:hypothetical protein
MATLANFAKFVSAVLLLYQSPPPLYFSLHKANGLGWLNAVFDKSCLCVMAADASDDCTTLQTVQTNVIATRSIMLF